MNLLSKLLKKEKVATIDQDNVAFQFLSTGKRLEDLDNEELLFLALYDGTPRWLADSVTSELKTRIESLDHKL